MKIEITEKEVEDIIFEGQKLEKHNIKCVQRQVRFGVAGIVDILGYDRCNKRWVIIEIKRDTLDAKAYAQGMRYRDWLSDYMDHRSCDRLRPYRDPYVLLIGCNLHEDLRFLRDINEDVNRDSRNSYYALTHIEPVLSLGCYSSIAGDSYQEGVFNDMDGGEY